MPDRLVVPLDGSETSSHVLPAAELLARALDVPIRLVTVQSPRVDALDDIAMLERVVDGLAAPALGPIVLEDDDVAVALLDHVAEDGNALLCMASHGRTGLSRVVLGSTTASVLARATAPVVVVGPRAAATAQLAVVEVVLDPTSDHRGLLVDAALELVRPGARLHLHHVGHPATDLLTAERARCEAAGVETTSDVVPSADVIDAVANAAAVHRAALIVVAAARPTVFGTVVEQLVHRAPCPVVVVPEG